MVLITGATGYIGGRLVPRLVEAGYRVRCLARSPRKLESRPWHDDPNVEIVQGDVSDQQSAANALHGCTYAYYLVHSMMAVGDGYADRDKRLAQTFADAAEQAGIQRIIYLGGLGEMGRNLSEHLASRREVEWTLRLGPVPVTAFRAAVIIGSGSVSFEILRYLVERLPVMVTPRWVQTECQPVAVRDVLHWLITCLSTPETAGMTIEIGGPDVLTYQELMQIMAEELGLPRRLIIPVPVLTPTLSSLWIGLVTPVTPRIARPLAEGLRNRVVVTNDRAQRLMPRDALTARTAIRYALGKVSTLDIETRWSAAGVIGGDPDWAGGTVFKDERSIEIDAPPDRVFDAVCRIGGGHGWYGADILWQIRGLMDQVVGGPGLRRGRRHPERVSYGEALDFWRVVGVEPHRALSLRAEMKLPGEAMLDFRIEPGRDAQQEANAGKSELVMLARFRPRGLFGLLYWYAVLPFHHVVFSGMLNGIRRSAEQ